MDQPVFPHEFVLKHCPKTLEARDWRKIYKVEGTDEDDTAFAECDFNPAGCGMACENCDEFLAGIRMNPTEERFLPLIRKYYSDMEKYEKYCEKQEQAKLNCGAGI